MNKLVVGLAGMPGSGKSIVVSVARESGYGVIVMGKEVREEASKRGIELTPENLGRLMLVLRQDEGEAAIAKRCIPKAENMREKRLILDGVRSLNEVDEFRKNFGKVTLIAIHASPETRFKRIHHRQRSDDSKTWKTFHERDLRELNVGLGSVMAMAEYIIMNEKQVDFVKRRTIKILRRIEERWMQ